MDNPAAKFYHDDCRICGAPATLSCPRCDMAKYCCQEHAAQHCEAHGEFCVAYDMAEQILGKATRQFRAASREANVDVNPLNFGVIQQVLDRPFRMWHRQYLEGLSTMANLLAHADTAKALRSSAARFSDLSENPDASHRITNRILPNLYLRLGQEDECIQSMLSAMGRYAGNRPETFDVLNTTLTHTDVGFLFIVIVLKIKAYKTLDHVNNVALTGSRLPLELVRICQEQAMTPLAWTIRDIWKKFGPEDGLSRELFLLERSISLMIKNLHSTNPCFLPGFFEPEAYVRIPLESYCPWVLPYVFTHRCSLRCYSHLEHTAQLAFLDTASAVSYLDGD